MQNKLMTEKERCDFLDKVVEPFGLSSYFNYTRTDEMVVTYCRSLVFSFLYKITESHLLEKKFSFYRLSYDPTIDKVLKMDLCDLIDSAIIDLKHYLAYIEKYKDENSIYYELNRLNDDYLDLMKIPEFNSKKYIREKINHIAELLPILEKRTGEKMPTKLEVDFCADTGYYSDSQIVKTNSMSGSFPLKKFWKYITPAATDEAILAKIEKSMFLEKVKDVRIEILNSIIEFKDFLKLDCLNEFLEENEIEKLKEFQTFFLRFNEKHCELFGKEELGYGEYRRSKRW